jgi:hypothetical protein
LKAHQLSHFKINFEVNMASFVDLCKVVDRKSAFSGLSSAQNGIENQKKRKKDQRLT